MISSNLSSKRIQLAQTSKSVVSEKEIKQSAISDMGAAKATSQNDAPTPKTDPATNSALCPDTSSVEKATAAASETSQKAQENVSGGSGC